MSERKIVRTSAADKRRIAALDIAISTAGSAVALSELLKVSKSAVGQWKKPGRKVPAGHCPAIEKLTEGKARCEDLNPKVNWSYMRGNEV